MDRDGNVIFGIDLGAKSVGWAVFSCADSTDGQPEPIPLLDAGVRCFDAGVDGNMDEGKGQARADARCMQRQSRRQLYRRAQRIRRTLRTLYESGLLANTVSSPPEARHKYLNELGARLC